MGTLLCLLLMELYHGDLAASDRRTHEKMGMVFEEFCKTAENAKDMVQKESGKNLNDFKINKIGLVKMLFFSKSDIKKYGYNDAKMNDRVYRWFLNNRQPKEADYVAVAQHIDKMLRNKDSFYYNLDKVIQDEKVYDEGIYFSAYADCFMEKWAENLVNSIGADLINKSSTFGSKVAAFFIHGFMGDKVLENIPCSMQTNYYIPRNEMEKLVQGCSDNRFICVEGNAYSGKTTLLIKYAKEKKIKIICCTAASSYEEVLDSIIIEEDAYLDSRKKKQLGYLLNAGSVEIKEKRLGQLEEAFWLIIDKFQGRQKDCKKLEALSKKSRISVFLEPVIPYPFFQDKPKIYIEPLTGSEIRELFYLMKNKYSGNLEGAGSDLEDQLVAGVQKAVYNNPALIILIAEYFWGMQANGKMTKSGGYSFLEDIAYGRNVKGGKYYSVLNSSKSEGKRQQKQHNILGHIRYIFEQYVPAEEQNVFYVLSLISSIDVEIQYIEKWFGISRDMLERLEWKGWCCVDREKMKAGIPQIVVHALKKDSFKTAESMEPFRIYIVERRIVIGTNSELFYHAINI